MASEFALSIRNACAEIVIELSILSIVASFINRVHVVAIPIIVIFVLVIIIVIIVIIVVVIILVVIAVRIYTMCAPVVIIDKVEGSLRNALACLEWVLEWCARE